MPPLKAKQHPDKTQDNKLRAMLRKTGRTAAQTDTVDLSTRRERLAALGVDEQTYRASGGTVED